MRLSSLLRVLYATGAIAFLSLGPGVVAAQPPVIGPAAMPVPGSAGPPQGPGARGSHSSPAREAAATVSAGLEKLFAFVRGSEGAQNRLQTAAFLDREIAPYFQFDDMARFVAGARWQALTQDQREALAAQLEARILSAVAERLIGYGGGAGARVQFVRPRTAGRPDRVDVQVGLAGQRGGYPTRLVFRLKAGDSDWRVYDVVAEGRSMLAFYRDAFERLMEAAPRD
jgi:phospholipid transport system substrate-binding protein